MRIKEGSPVWPEYGWWQLLLLRGHGLARYSLGRACILAAVLVRHLGLVPASRASLVPVKPYLLQCAGRGVRRNAGHRARMAARGRGKLAGMIARGRGTGKALTSQCVLLAPEPKVAPHLHSLLLLQSSTPSKRCWLAVRRPEASAARGIARAATHTYRLAPRCRGRRSCGSPRSRARTRRRSSRGKCHTDTFCRSTESARAR